MKKIWLVRHAQSKAQTEEEFSLDSSLSSAGRGQAARLRGVFGGMSFDRAFISPLKRARETFELAQINCADIAFDSRLAEIVPGDGYDSILPCGACPDYGKPDTWNAWSQPPQKRLASFLDDLSSLDCDKILVVGHAMALSMLLNIFLRGREYVNYEGLNSWGYCFMSNTAVSMISIDKELRCGRLIFWNCCSHIEGWSPLTA
jgi:broad specificity phosphatase PhoE